MHRGITVICNDNIACTSDSGNEITDTWDFIPLDGSCTDGNACTIDSCDLAGGCRYVALNYNDVFSATAWRPGTRHIGEV